MGNKININFVPGSIYEVWSGEWKRARVYYKIRNSYCSEFLSDMVDGKYKLYDPRQGFTITNINNVAMPGTHLKWEEDIENKGIIIGSVCKVKNQDYNVRISKYLGSGTFKCTKLPVINDKSIKVILQYKDLELWSSNMIYAAHNAIVKRSMGILCEYRESEDCWFYAYITEVKDNGDVKILYQDTSSKIISKFLKYEEQIFAPTGINLAYIDEKMEKEIIDRYKKYTINNNDNKVENKVSDIGICAICYENKVSIMFDCGHFICEACDKINKCHICRKVIENKKKVYL